MPTISNMNAGAKEIENRPLTLITPEMEAEEERLWQEEFAENREFYMALADEALEEYKQSKKQAEVFAGTGKSTTRSKTSWLNTVGIYPEESPLNRMLDAGAKIREAENAEQC